MAGAVLRPSLQFSSGLVSSRARPHPRGRFTGRGIGLRLGVRDRYDGGSSGTPRDSHVRRGSVTDHVPPGASQGPPAPCRGAGDTRNNRRAFEKVWPGTWWIERPGVVLVMRGRRGRTRRRARPDQGRGVRTRGKPLAAARAHRAGLPGAPPRCGVPCATRASTARRRVRCDTSLHFTGHPRIQPGCRTFCLARKAGA